MNFGHLLQKYWTKNWQLVSSNGVFLFVLEDPESLFFIKKMSGTRSTHPQSKEALLKSYNTRLKEDVKSMLENFEGKV